ncbi:MAG: phage holin family protein [Candidatus Dormibacteria bacterium]
MASKDLVDQTVPQLVQDLGGDLRQLVAAEVELAKAEIKQSARRGLRVVLAGAVAALGAMLLLIFGLVTLVEWIPNHTLVAGILGIVGIALLAVGGGVVWSNRHLWPFTASQQSLQEDLEWARRLSRRAHR